MVPQYKYKHFAAAVGLFFYELLSIAGRMSAMNPHFICAIESINYNLSFHRCAAY